MNVYTGACTAMTSPDELAVIEAVQALSEPTCESLVALGEDALERACREFDRIQSFAVEDACDRLTRAALASALDAMQGAAGNP